MTATTLADLLADPSSREPAILAHDGALAISYRGLAEQIEAMAATLAAAGLRKGDAVAVVLPNGPEFIVLLLALARAGIIAAPLNPAYTADELRGLLADVAPRAIVAAAELTAVAAAAAGLGVPIWTASVDASGTVSLAGAAPGPGGSLVEPAASDVAVFLHTSGTSGAPKVVPLTHANLVSSAQHIATHYALTPADRSLVVMPLFHGHGLVGAALATLASGGALIVPPRFSASHFWPSFRRQGATWYTAVPTIHQILLSRADADGAPRSGIRFIRSCSSALAPPVLTALEQRCGAPVLEAYGMTEAAHQVASNPLPPRPHKPGSVGIGTGTELAVVDGSGRHLAAHQAGEVVVRGPGVMRGYRNNPAATAAAFVDGWLRTGDAGVLDAEGFLSLTGRIKELINRGGEKISPTEIDNVLLAHPAVAEAATFGVPDQKYGEAIQAAVVLKGDTDSARLRAFCRERLADFKVPDVIWIVSAMPKNPLGKIERAVLSARFGQAPT